MTQTTQSAGIELQAGDIFCSRNPMALGGIINTVQKFWASDNESKYTHAGIILNPSGETIESLWTVKNQNIFMDYSGEQVIIGRHSGMTLASSMAGKLAIDEHENQWYPFLRLLLFGLPPFAKYLYFRRVVCSELTAKFLWGAGLTSYWKGVNPDMIYDMIVRWKHFKIVFEGKI